MKRNISVKTLHKFITLLDLPFYLIISVAMSIKYYSKSLPNLQLESGYTNSDMHLSYFRCLCSVTVFLAVCSVISFHCPKVVSLQTSSLDSLRIRSRLGIQDGCPKECVCRDNGRRVNCTDRYLNYIPHGISKSVQRL